MGLLGGVCAVALVALFLNPVIPLGAHYHDYRYAAFER